MKEKVKCVLGLFMLSFMGCDTSTDEVLDAKIGSVKVHINNSTRYSSSISHNHFSKRNPIATSNEGKEPIDFSEEEMQLENEIGLTDFMKQLAPKEEVFLLDPSKDTSLFCTGGTKLFICKESFITNANLPVLATIQLKVKEYLDLASLLSSNLTTQSEYGELLSTEGVLHLSAFSNDTEVYLRKGKSIQMEFPCSGNYPKIWLFEGAIDNSDCVQWRKLNKVVYKKSNKQNPSSILESDSRSIVVKDEDGKIIYKKDSKVEKQISEEYLDSMKISVSIDEQNRLVSSDCWVSSTNEKIKPSIVCLQDNFLSNHRRSRLIHENDELPIKAGFGITIQVGGVTHFIVVDREWSRKRTSIFTKNKGLTFTITKFYSGQNLDMDKSAVMKNEKKCFFSISKLGWYNIAARNFKKVENKVVAIEDSVFNKSTIYLIGRKDKTVRITMEINNRYEFFSNPNEAVLVAIKMDEGKLMVYCQSLAQTDRPFIATEKFRVLTLPELIAKLNSEY